MATVVHIITGLSGGGAESSLFKLVTNSVGYKHIVISLSDGGVYGPRLRKEGIEVYCLGMRRGRFNLFKIASLVVLLRNLKPVLVQTWMYHSDLLGGLSAKLAGVKKVCWTIRNSDIDRNVQGNVGTRLVVRLCALLSYIVPNRIVACATRAIQVHIEKGYQKSRFLLIHNGIDTQRFSPDHSLRAEMRAILGYGSQDKVIGTVARFHPQKGFSDLFEAFAAVSVKSQQAKLMLAGTGMDDSNTELVQLLSRYDIEKNVQLLGFRSDLHSLYNAMDIHVLTSRYGEAFPNVVAEAMATGTVSLATDVGDAAFILGDKQFVAEPGNVHSIVQTLMSAFKLLDQKRSMPQEHGQRRRIVEDFSLSKMVNAYEDLWNSLSN